MACIMVIDDDDLFRSLLRIHLQHAGHKVLVWGDGALAIRGILAERPDMVLLDLNMPFLNGFELLEALRGDPLTQHIPVIVISGNTDPETHDKVLALGAAAFLNKPVNKEMLLAAVAKHLSAGG